MLVIVATFSYFGSHYSSIKSSESSIIRGVTDVEERHYYNIHSWQDLVPVTSTRKVKRIIYNRVGKCGSRTMIQLISSLARKRDFTVIGSTRYKLLHLDLRDQVEFVDFIDNLRAPFIYHHHVHFVDFKRFGAVQPIYINLIRDPLARLVSAYYYRRFGDYREGHRTWGFKGTEKQKNQSFDECVLNDVSECVDPGKIFYIVPFFCGHEAFCRQPSQLALKQAKINVMLNYLVVGVTEELQDFLSVLEKLLPDFFTGVLELYKAPGDVLQKGMTTTKTANKKGPSPKVAAIVKKHLEIEYDFYNFVKDRFHRLKAELGLRTAA